MNEHRYEAFLRWTGDRGEGTADYRSYGREHVITAPGKADLEGSSDRAFRGDASRWNPEELLVAALSSCHMLMYLHLCADAGATVVGYEDDAASLVSAARGRRNCFQPVRRRRYWPWRRRMRATLDAVTSSSRAMRRSANRW